MQARSGDLVLSLWLLFAGHGVVCGAEVATVNQAQIDVYGKPAKIGVVVDSLQRGTAVSIDFSISNAEGEWCSVTELGVKAERAVVAGYVLCEQLLRPKAEKRTVVLPLPDVVAGAAEAKKQKLADTRFELKRNELLIYNYYPYYWADQLGFSADQRARMEGLLRESGVTACNEETRAIYRKYAIITKAALISALIDPQASKEVFGRYQLCGGALVAFWERFPEILNASQKLRFEADRKLVSRWSGFAESQMLMTFPPRSQKR